MRNSSLFLFSFSLLLLICSLTGHVVKRKAPDGKLYVFSKRVGCVSIKSEAPCSLTWQLNPYLAKVYKQNNEIVAATTKLYKDLGFHSSCVTAVKNALCSQVVPRCRWPDGDRDYGDVTKFCTDIYASCPQGVVNSLKQNKFCQSLKKGKHPNSPCVAPSEPITGDCPQPKYKMPEEFLAGYRKVSDSIAQQRKELREMRYDNGERVFSEECILQIEEINCSPLYCSANESQLLIKHDSNDCHTFVKNCFEDALLDLASYPTLRKQVDAIRSNLESRCNTYPSPTDQLQSEPPFIKIIMQPVTTLRPATESPQPETTHVQQQDKKAVSKNGNQNSGGSRHCGHPVVLMAVTYFLINIYV